MGRTTVQFQFRVFLLASRPPKDLWSVRLEREISVSTRKGSGTPDPNLRILNKGFDQGRSVKPI